MTATVDHDAIGRVPVGYLYITLCAALAKRALVPTNLPAGERLHLLEKLNDLTDSLFTVDMLAAVQPMTDIECKMIAEAMSLDGERADGRCPAADAVLTRPDVFAHFAAANPSLLVVLKLAVPKLELCSGAANVTAQAPDAGPSERMAEQKAEAAARKALPAYGAAAEKFHTRRMQ